MTKKVLFILDNLEGGGAEKVFVNIANGFVANNIPVELLLGEKKGVNLGSLHPAIRIEAVGSTNFFDYLKSFSRIFRENRYSHIFTASHYVGAAAILAKKKLGIRSKIYQTHHYSYPAKRSLKHLKGDMLLKMLYYFTAPSADRIIAVSKGSLDWLRRFSHRKLNQGSYIYNPVYDRHIYPLSKEPVDFPINVDGKTILLNAGRLSEQKDQFTLIDAYAIYRRSNPNAVLFILGTGPLEEKLRDYITQLNLTKEVFLVGYQQNPYKWMAKCHVFVLSSVYEGFGNVIAEAMALGTTVVSTDCPSGPSEILDNGRLGYLCPVQDPAALALAIEAAVNNPMDKELLKSSSLQYSNPVVVEQYIAAL